MKPFSKKLTRRDFIYLAGTGATAALLTPPWRATAAPVWLNVWILTPRPACGYPYQRAHYGHFRHKIHPSLEAALSGRPHPGLVCDPQQLPLPFAGIDIDTLFGGRKDLDVRVRADVRHMKRLGIDVDALAQALAQAIP